MHSLVPCKVPAVLPPALEFTELELRLNGSKAESVSCSKLGPQAAMSVCSTFTAPCMPATYVEHQHVSLTQFATPDTNSTCILL